MQDDIHIERVKHPHAGLGVGEVAVGVADDAESHEIFRDAVAFIRGLLSFTIKSNNDFGDPFV
jgi:hypothetical protein